jgi:hypothetical protein
MELMHGPDGCLCSLLDRTNVRRREKEEICEQNMYESTI